MICFKVQTDMEKKGEIKEKNKSDLVIYAYCPSSWEVKAERLGV